MTEVLKQRQYNPQPVEEQVAILWAGSEGHIDDVPVDQVRAFEDQYLEYLRTSGRELLETIKNEKTISDETAAALTKATREFKATNNFGAGRTSEQPAESAAAAD
jgi:F-type H+-transporting ATPase subunit alpha